MINHRCLLRCNMLSTNPQVSEGSTDVFDNRDQHSELLNSRSLQQRLEAAAVGALVCLWVFWYLNKRFWHILETHLRAVMHTQKKSLLSHRPPTLLPRVFSKAARPFSQSIDNGAHERTVQMSTPFPVQTASQFVWDRKTHCCWHS